MESENVLEINNKHRSKKHDIFSRDPAHLYNFLYKEVEIICVTKDVYRGRVYTVDPVSFSFVLYPNSNRDNSVEEVMTLVVGHNISAVNIINDHVDEELKSRIDALYSCPMSKEIKKLKSSDHSGQKAKLVEWFESNCISVKFSGSDENVLTINDMVEIRPPYTRNDCFCTNHLVLGKILDILDSMPSGDSV